MFTLYDGLAGSGWLWPHIGATLKIVLYGFVFALVLGVPLGIALGSSGLGQNLAAGRPEHVRRP